MSPSTPQASIEQLEAALSHGATLVDVREPVEFAEGHIPGARPIPMGQLSSRLRELNRSAPSTSSAQRATGAPR